MLGHRSVLGCNISGMSGEQREYTLIKLKCPECEWDIAACQVNGNFNSGDYDIHCSFCEYPLEYAKTHPFNILVPALAGITWKRKRGLL